MEEIVQAMGSLRGISIAIFVVQALLASVALVSAQGSATPSRWQTLSGAFLSLASFTFSKSVKLCEIKKKLYLVLFGC